MARAIIARVASSTRTGMTTLEWRELLDVRHEEADFGDGPEAYDVPVYGEVLAATERPRKEFLAAMADESVPAGRRLRTYVRRHLPPPVTRTRSRPPGAAPRSEPLP